MIECSNVWRKENREVHKFLRAIGFSDITKKDLEMILDEVITCPEIMKILRETSLRNCQVHLRQMPELRFGVLIRKMTVFIWIITIRMCLVPVLRRMSRLM